MSLPNCLRIIYRPVIARTVSEARQDAAIRPLRHCEARSAVAIQKVYFSGSLHFVRDDTTVIARTASEARQVVVIQERPNWIASLRSR